jgi:hypothetical protein
MWVKRGAHQRHPFTMPPFWATVAFLFAYAAAGALVMAGAGPSMIGRMIGILEGLVLVAIGAMFVIALAKPDATRRFLGGDNDE